MPTITVRDSLSFHYSDSGIPNVCNYTTLFILHGHTFHSGTFSKIAHLAGSRALRLICIDRRDYQGSKPHSPEELHIIHHGTYTQRADYIAEQGVLLGLAIDGLIQTLNLPMSGGGALAGWSMGNIYALAILNSTKHPGLPQESKKRLITFLRTFILWDAPSMNMGIPTPPNGYLPLWDKELPEHIKGPATAKFISSYFDHDPAAVEKRDVSGLNYRSPSSRTPTIEKLSLEELASITDFSAGPKCENIIACPSFRGIHQANIHNALFDHESATSNWDINIWCLYGAQCHWSMMCTAWDLEKKAQRANRRMKFKSIAGANHFLVWDDPELAIDTLKRCVDTK